MSDITHDKYLVRARRTNRGTDGDRGPHLWRFLARTSRAVSVRVEEDGREVDGFESRSPQGLKAALAPIVAHLTAWGTLRFKGIEERRVLGRVISRREAILADQAAASAFLAYPGAGAHQTRETRGLAANCSSQAEPRLRRSGDAS